MRRLSFLALLVTLSSDAALECPQSEIDWARRAVANAREANCRDLRALREASEQLRNLAMEPLCDRAELKIARQALQDARVKSFLSPEGTSCVDLLNRAETALGELKPNSLRPTKSKRSDKGSAAP